MSDDSSERLSFTKEEIAQQYEAAGAEAVAAARAEWEKEHATKAEQEKADLERATAAEQGKWKELAEKSERERDDARREARTLNVSNSLKDHLLDKYPDYAKSAKYILPLIPGDVKDADLPAVIEKAAKDFAADNPRVPQRLAGVPATARFQNQDNKNGSRASLSTDPVGHIMAAYPGPRLPGRN